jgi:hypothetical protein
MGLVGADMERPVTWLFSVSSLVGLSLLVHMATNTVGFSDLIRG